MKANLKITARVATALGFALTWAALGAGLDKAALVKAPAAPAPEKTTPTHGDWVALIPKVAEKIPVWKGLVDGLLKERMYYGAMTASHRMITLFNDQEAKEKAYQTMVDLIDLGYPYSTLNYFATGDLEPQTDDYFASAYYLYKGIAALDNGMKKWADSYFSLINKENFEKYSFFRAIEAYQKNDLATAKSLLITILSKKATPENFSLMKKTARTLARIYFEEKNYAKSFDIYNSFLLTLNPIEPNDWLESAWDLYYLKEYNWALGTLYNLESKTAGGMVNLEKYELRALIYQALCQNKYADQLYFSFEHEFGAAIHAVKIGVNLTKIAPLNHIYADGNQLYYELVTTLKNLRDEQKNISKLDGRYRELAGYLYRTEIVNLERKIPFYADDASQLTSDNLIGYSEKLRLIKFDTAKTDFSATSEPVVVAKKTGDPPPVEPEPVIHWIQTGTFWRDERAKYRALVTNRCAN